MNFIGAADIERLVDYPSMIDAVENAFRSGIITPVRHHHTVTRPAGSQTTLLLMPAWTDFTQLQDGASGHIGVKIVTVSPDNGALNKPAIMGLYILLNGNTGEPRAIIDGQALTVFRTAATSALAARFMSRQDCKVHLVIGAGALSTHLARAHRAVRPIETTLFWNRNISGARLAAERLAAFGFEAEVVENLDEAVRRADIISAATLSTEPLIKGNFVKEGAHLDLVGAFNAQMRETDDTAVLRSRVFVDTFAGALKEGGDIVQPINDGIISAEHIQGELAMLISGESEGRRSADEITLFKSVGAALEDLAAGILIEKRYQAGRRSF
jgi:ornithine cyclodeaminase/alanine dehydrogenase-like protein (mu-crystallin family)